MGVHAAAEGIRASKWCYCGGWYGLVRCVRAFGAFGLSRHVGEERFELARVDSLDLLLEEDADQYVGLVPHPKLKYCQAALTTGRPS